MTTTIAIIVDLPPDAVADISAGLRGLFRNFAEREVEIVTSDDPDLARVVRGFTYSEYQDDPEREVERLAALVAKAALQPVPA